MRCHQITLVSFFLNEQNKHFTSILANIIIKDYNKFGCITSCKKVFKEGKLDKLPYFKPVLQLARDLVEEIIVSPLFL